MLESGSDSESYQSRSRSREKIANKKSSYSGHSSQQDNSSFNFRQISISQPEDIAIQLSNAFLIFFEECQHRKGFIMLPSQRSKLQKEQQKYQSKKLPKVDWTDKPYWKSTQQTVRIEQIFKRENLNLSQLQIASFKQIFFETSPMFGVETTQQLYQLLMEVIIMCLRYRENSQKEVRNFFLNDLQKSTKYKFINFRFSKKVGFKLKNNKEKVYEKLGVQLHKQLSRVLHSIN